MARRCTAGDLVSGGSLRSVGADSRIVSGVRRRENSVLLQEHRSLRGLADRSEIHQVTIGLCR